MNKFTTWGEWLDAQGIPLRDIASVIVCGPKLPDCELTRAGICAVVNRGIGVLEQWADMQACGLCQGIEHARTVACINALIGLSPLEMQGKGIKLHDFVKWAQSKRSISIPKELRDILQV